MSVIVEGKPAQMEYFANLKGPELGRALNAKKDRFEKFIRETRLYDLWRRSYQYYHSQDEKGRSSHYLSKTGPKGKLAVFKINQFRSIVKSWRNIAIAQRAALQPIAKYSGYHSEVQVKRAKALLEHHMTHSQLEQLMYDAIEFASIVGSGFLVQGWRKQAGDVVLPTSLDGLLGEGAAPPAPEQKIGEGAPPEAMSNGIVPKPADPILSGKLTVKAMLPIDVILDPMSKTHDVPWYILRSYENKYEIASRYAKNDPALFANICTMGQERDMSSQLNLGFGLSGDMQLAETDDIPIYEFRHKKTDACPNGKVAVYVGDGSIVLEEGPLEYEELRVRRIAPAEILNTPWGYTEAWDLLAAQEVTDVLNSISFTNQKSFGVGTMLSPKGAGLTSTDVAEGLKMIEYNPGMEKPSPIQFPSTPREVFENRKNIIKEMGTNIGVNSVVRGDPEKSLESGAALALVQAQAVQYSTDFQGRIVRFEEGCGDDNIGINQKFLTYEQEFAIIGTPLARMVKFDREGISEIIGVQCKTVNPLSKSVAGRWQLAEMLSQRYAEDVPVGKLFRFMQSGDEDVLLEEDAQEDRNIERENEMMMEGIGPPPMQPVIGPDGMPVVDPMTGKPQEERSPGEPGKEYVRAIITDNPIKHMNRHRCVGDSPAARNNPAVMKAYLEHMADHEKQYTELTLKRPGLLQVLGVPPLQAAMPMSPPGMGPGPGGEGEGPPGGGVREPPPGGAVPDDEKPPAPGGPPKMPAYPKNPATGDRYQPPTPQR